MSITSIRTDSRPAPQPFQSKAGYTGAISLLCLAFGSYFFFANKLNEQLNFTLVAEQLLIICVAITLSSMLLHEYIQKAHLSHQPSKAPTAPYQANLIKSSLYRYVVYLGLIALPWFIVNQHYYFQDPSFNSTRILYLYLLYSYFILGLPYIYLTLRLKSSPAYELNDYAILTLIGLKSLLKSVLSYPLTGNFQSYFLRNHRIKKITLVFLVNFFFLTLMSKFLVLEYHSFAHALNRIVADNFVEQRFFVQYHTIYLMLFHLIFIIDVGLAIIGYSIASRWLNNRTKSVDMSLSGWLVVLLCYPPMNSGFTDQLISYGRVETQPLITSEAGLMIIMPLILFCFFIYVWATAALGFKFSNLTNRGIVHLGPYRFLRHPAYTCKNLAWWIDNSYVLSNIWAALALFTWNIIYVLRGITEEQHLANDSSYRDYQKRVPYRFIPGFKSPKWTSKQKKAKKL